MKKLFLLGILFLTISSNSQITLIPDVNFEQALINLGYDTGSPDGSVPTANLSSVYWLNVSFSNISDLTGIQDFGSLSILSCQDNQIISLNVSQNTALTELNCESNLLTNLDVSQNINLTWLHCNHNQIASLDISQNSALYYFSCVFNLLECLKVKNGNNNILNYFYASFNPNLTCIEVDDAVWSTNNWIEIDGQTSFSTNCGNPCSLAINELNSNSTKILSKIIDLSGREIQYQKNTMMLYIYEDGTSERVLEIE